MNAVKGALTIRPLGDYLFVRPDPPQTATRGGLVIPEWGVADDPTNPHMPCTGTVAAVGRGAHTRKKGVFVAPDVLAGDRILFSRWAGMDKGVSLNGEWYRVIAECDVQAVLEDVTVEGFQELV